MKPNREVLLRLIRDHFNREVQSILVCIGKNDGIGLEYPTGAAEAFAEAILGHAEELSEPVAEPEWVRVAHAMFKAWGEPSPGGAWFDYQTKAQLLVNVLNLPTE